MRAECFIDTNVVLYAMSTDAAEAGKRKRARELLRGDDWGLSVQVLQELYVNLIRPRNPLMTHADAVLLLRQLMLRPLIVSDSGLMLDALDLRARFRLSYWDAAIVAAALRLGCSVLWTEDLNHGQEIGTLRIANPFR
ncbi:MAG: PIN domain-containing protein [Wenzhouxiangellaceae bacterium]|nr:PIN domain-containing protein [Wenzhouxiangellaceae bacterium]